MNKQELYEIYTDASFDIETKLGAYGIIIKKDGSIIKTISKKCRLNFDNPTECEVFSIYQAINYIAGTLLNKKKIQKFHIITDCISAMNFFKTNDKINIFKKDQELSFLMRNIYKKIKSRLKKKNGKIEIMFVKRNNNKTSHNCSYSAFRQLKERNSLSKNEFDYKILFINKEIFFEILTNFTKIHHSVIIYLIRNMTKDNVVNITQKDIAKDFKISISKINKVFKELIEVGILDKIKNGKYALLI